MDINLETCFLAFLFGFVLYLLVNRVFMVEGITNIPSCNTMACDTSKTKQSCYYEPRCASDHQNFNGGVGCKADGINQTCRFCDQDGLPSCDGSTPPPPSPGPSPPPPTPPSGDIPKPEYGMCLDAETVKLEPSLENINGGKWYGEIRPFNQNNSEIRMIRMFDYYRETGRGWTKWLIENDIRVFIGIYQSQHRIEEQIDLLLKDYSDAKNDPELKKKWDKNIVGISMGNEPNHTDAPMSAGDIKIHLDKLQNYKKQKQLPDVPITSVLVGGESVADHQEGINEGDPNYWNPLYFRTGDYLEAIAKSIDVVSVNIYPYWAANFGACSDNDYFACKNVDNEGSVFHDQMMQVKTSMRNDNELRGKELWITETGWANDNDREKKRSRPQSSSARARNFYTNILTNLNQIHEQDQPDKIFYFTFRDTPEVQAYFGLEGVF